MSNNQFAIIHGDCAKVTRDMEASSVDLIFADPPYNLGIDDKAEYVERATARLDEAVQVQEALA